MNFYHIAPLCESKDPKISSMRVVRYAQKHGIKPAAKKFSTL